MWRTFGMLEGMSMKTLLSSRVRSEDLFVENVLGHTDALYGIACKFTRDPHEAEDLVQDTLLKAIRSQHQFEAGTNLKAWLCRILTNTFINRYRRSGLERSVMDGAEHEPVADGWVSAAAMRQLRDPEDLSLQPLIGAEIGRALDALPPDYRLAVLLCDVEEFSYEEIAQIMGCPIGTVMSRLHRGRKLLQKTLLDHAVSMGIVSSPASAQPSAQQSEVTPAADLAEYRARSARTTRKRGAA